MEGKKLFKRWFAPVGVSIGITVHLFIWSRVVKRYEIDKISAVFSFMPRKFIVIPGLILSIIGPIVFLSGIIRLGRDAAIGYPDKLESDGIFNLIRNPMYAGVIYTLLGAGLLFDRLALALTGINWFGWSFLQDKREKRELTLKFGEAYESYREKTPGFFPGFRCFSSAD